MNMCKYQLQHCMKLRLFHYNSQHIFICKMDAPVTLWILLTRRSRCPGASLPFPPNFISSFFLIYCITFASFFPSRRFFFILFISSARDRHSIRPIFFRRHCSIPLPYPKIKIMYKNGKVAKATAMRFFSISRCVFRLEPKCFCGAPRCSAYHLVPLVCLLFNKRSDTRDQPEIIKLCRPEAVEMSVKVVWEV